MQLYLANNNSLQYDDFINLLSNHCTDTVI